MRAKAIFTLFLLALLSGIVSAEDHLTLDQLFAYPYLRGTTPSAIPWSPDSTMVISELLLCYA